MGRAYRKRRKGQHKQTPDPADISHTSDVIRSNIALSRFCVNHGCEDVKTLRPYFFRGCGRGLQTLRSLNPGDCIVQIPRHLLITTGTALRNSVIRETVLRSELKPTPLVLVIAFLLLEKSKGEKSHWYPYLQSVPQTYTTLHYIHMGDLDLLDLELRLRYDISQGKLLRSWEDYKQLFSSVITSYISFRDFLWAWHVINTRSVYMKSQTQTDLSLTGLVRVDSDNEDNFALAPYLDLLNHTDTAQVKAGYNTETGCYEILTHDTYKKYDQVFISYGAHDNRFLLLEYGFSITGNTNNIVHFAADELIGVSGVICDHNRSPVYKELQKINLTDGLLCDREGLSWNLLEALRLLSNSEGEESCEDLTTKLLNKSIQCRERMIERILQRKLTYNNLRSTSEHFILDMLSSLYKDELELLRKASVT